jgi:hypothetical protein
MRLPLWTPDQVRGDDVSDKRALTLRSAASRRGSPLQAPHLQPLLRDGATAPPQDENGSPRPVIFAQAGIQGHTHKSHLPPWTPDQVRGDDISDKCTLTLRSVASRRGSPLQALRLQRILRDGANAPPQDEGDTPRPVILAQAGIQGHTHQSRLPLWTPDHVRGDDISDKCTLTLRSAASRRGSPLQAPPLQPLLRDGAIAPPQDENGTSRPVIFAQAGIQGHTHKSSLPPWTPDHVRGDDVSDKRALTLRSVASRRGSPL